MTHSLLYISGLYFAHASSKPNGCITDDGTDIHLHIHSVVESLGMKVGPLLEVLRRVARNQRWWWGL